MSNKCLKFNVVSLAFSLGITWGLGMLIAGWLDWWTTGYADSFVKVFSSIYIGFGPSFWGGIVGFIWGFVDLFVAGLIVAWIYNGCVGSAKQGE